MSKLYFRYGAMGSAKSMNLIAVAHNYERQGKQAHVMRAAPRGEYAGTPYQITSRCGLTFPAHNVVSYEAWSEVVPEDLYVLCRDSLGLWSCVLVDEAQFLHPSAVDYLRSVATAGTPVICYGLRTDFRSRLFEGSKRLLEVADSIEEVKTTCAYCDRKATQNLRLVESSDQVLIGGDETYAGACWGCFTTRTGGIL